MAGANGVGPAPKRARRDGGEEGGEAPAKSGSARPSGNLTVQEIASDKLTRIAHENWSIPSGSDRKLPAFNAELVVDIYNSELGGSGDKGPQLKRIMLLEISQYLEKYLWPNFDPLTSSFQHVMSIVLMVNEKLRESIPAWSCFTTRQAVFLSFFQRVVKLGEDHDMRLHEKVAYLMFMINAFQSLENKLVQPCVLKLVSLPLWHALSKGRLQLELHSHPELAKLWKKLAKREAKLAKEEGYVPIQQRAEVTFFPGMIEDFLQTLQSIVSAPDTDPPAHGLLYCQRFVEWLIDLLSQLPTRRLLRTLLDQRAVLVKAKMSSLYTHRAGRLFVQLVDLFQLYMWFPIDDHTAEPLTEEDVTAQHYDRLLQLQRLFFKHWPQLKELALTNCATLEKREYLRKQLSPLDTEDLRKLVTKQLRLVSEDDPWLDHPGFLQEVLITAFERRRFQRDVVNEMPLYPTEQLLYDEHQVPDVHYTGESCLALPKLNLQFLTLYDYLLRNFHLFRLEATYEIREDVSDVLSRIKPYWNDEDKVVFSGWARMAIPVQKFNIIEVKSPNVGENKPAAVTADVVIDTKGLRGEIRGEWDELKQHDVLFVMTIQPPDEIRINEIIASGRQPTVCERYGLMAVRGGEVIEVRDEEGTLMNDFTGRIKRDEWQPPQGFVRTVTMALDSAQYQLDVNHMAKHKTADVYAGFNTLMRRKPKENNFKAVLESIRDLMNEECKVPDWLHEILLGYGKPEAAQYTHMEGALTTIDFKDTFLDAEHLRSSFPHYTVDFVNNRGTLQPARPFRITFSKLLPPDQVSVVPAPEERPRLTAESYTPPDPGPYPQNKPPLNSVRFTPVQVSAILSGVQPGLTMVVGPPGTGKTDTAVQIMEVLYHNCPEQRTLLITHSNQALNDLFQKIMERDVPSRYLLRLGMGEQELDTDLDFSRVGRVNAMLTRRLELLAEVEKMARQLKVPEEVAYTCETAAYFWLLHVLSRWEKFVAQASAKKTPQAVKDLFPFKEYFADVLPTLFEGKSYESDMEKARGCFRHLKTMFQELEECRAFELLKGQADRVNYLMTKQAKIVAMTCTHAALKRHEFLELAFKYDNLLMEEAAQILEIETFIPFMLQKQEDGYSRLKRVVMIGDHHQLPPVVKNMAFQKYSHLDQSLFTRFVRLGTPYVELNAQGRARPSLASLYNWRYRDLGDLPNVKTQERFVLANPGFAYECQVIDVPDFNGVGESEPIQYFYQNLGEAEYVVTVFQYMRLLGYPAEKISVLTTYNGQKALLKDVIERRCAQHPAFGRPAKVATVDKYQGQQNDYILLSLVRTKAFGHLRDVRRLVVAMSRSRLGLYVFGRADLFGNCYELQPTFKQLLSKPTKLAVLPDERYAVTKRPVHDIPSPLLCEGLQEAATLVTNMTGAWEAEHSRNRRRG